MFASSVSQLSRSQATGQKHLSEQLCGGPPSAVVLLIDVMVSCIRAPSCVVTMSEALVKAVRRLEWLGIRGYKLKQARQVSLRLDSKL